MEHYSMVDIPVRVEMFFNLLNIKSLLLIVNISTVIFGHFDL